MGGLGNSTEHTAYLRLKEGIDAPRSGSIALNSKTVTLENVHGHSQQGERSLAIHYHGIAPGRVGRVETGTFIPSTQAARYFDQRGYSLMASPTLYQGQVIRAGVSANLENWQPIRVNLFLRYYDPNGPIRSGFLMAVQGNIHFIFAGDWDANTGFD